MSATPQPRSVVVCGSRFGRFYAAAVDRHPALRLVAILGRGSVASRELAARYDVPLVGSVADCPPTDLACVAVGSTIQGGAGSEIATAWMERGVSVVQEHPVHPRELADLLRTARRTGTSYRMNLHYRWVDPAPEFLAATARLRARQEPVFADVVTPVHLLLPVLDLLAGAIGAARPATAGDVLPERGGSPFTVMTLTLGGVPVTLRVQNQLCPTDRDNHTVCWPRIAVGFPAGVLTLADLHGPVEWAPRWQLGGGTGPQTATDEPTVSTTGAPGTFDEVFADRWPTALSRVLDEFCDDVDAGRDPLRAASWTMSVVQLWHQVAESMGPPQVVEARPAELLGTAAVLGTEPPSTGPSAQEPAPDGGAGAGWEPYVDEAEFFDLAASGHVDPVSAPLVVEALAGAPVGPDRPVVEIGAGTGLLTVPAASALPDDVPWWAAEPAAPMRAVLMARVLDHGLQRRVTVLPDDAASVALPAHAGAVLLCGVLGHLDDAGHDRLWARLRDHLAPGAPVVVELMNLTSPQQIDEAELATQRVGTNTYRWRWSARPDGAHHVQMSSRWQVHTADGLDRESTVTHRWRTCSVPDVAAVAERHGFRLDADLSHPASTPMAVFRLTPQENHV
ncbi:Gfo/Idh/MocA family oxidoreductase [Isoptericola croceus]|uniref:Gfo/Idh/MocA family oxidoreductase n=1 Tax=Isoptericola croceus TaxID=3031406 RepID=UPI0023F79CCB|nr:Gfo/Idh/MocA family oxidoreductase [Isoptericola croceus]